MPTRGKKETPASLEEALASDNPIGAIMEAVDTTKASGALFNSAHAFMLETFSARMSMLFDRYEDDELDKMEAGLAAIGASEALADWRVVRAGFNETVAGGMDRYDASEEIDSRAELDPVLSRFAEHADEIEARLVAYAKANWAAITKS
jgi:hypothetical protein